MKRKTFAALAALGFALPPLGAEGGGALRISVSDESRTVVFELNGSPASRSLYDELPLTADVENYGGNEKIFYPPKKLDTARGVEGGGGAGDLAYFSPWGNVVMYYGSYGAYPGLYRLGRAVSGAELISSLRGTIRIEKAK